MTKIKNTKKGMAKKTLSMSLVVAMLATSNVPVWAAEFSDGSDVAVATEAPAEDAFSAEADAAPVVEDNTEEVSAAQDSATNYGYTSNITLKEDGNGWAGNIVLKDDVVVKDGNGNVVDAGKYTWTIRKDGYEVQSGWTNAPGVGLKAGAANWCIPLSHDDYNHVYDVYIEITMANGQKVGLTSNKITVSPVDIDKIAKANGNYLYFANYTDDDRQYTGKEIKLEPNTATYSTIMNVDGKDLTKDDFVYTYSGDLVNYTDENITVTGKVKLAGTNQEDPAYVGGVTGTYKIAKRKITATDINNKLTVELKNPDISYEYTSEKKVFTADDVKVEAKSTLGLDDSVKDFTYAVKKVEATAAKGNDFGNQNVTITLDTSKMPNFTWDGASNDEKTLVTSNYVKIKTRDLSKVTATVNRSYSVDELRKGVLDHLTAADLTFKDANGNEIKLSGNNDINISVDDAIIKKATSGAGSYAKAIKITAGTAKFTTNPSSPETCKESTTADLTIIEKGLSNGKFVGATSADANYATANEEFAGEGVAVTKDTKRLGNFIIKANSSDPGYYLTEGSDYIIEYANNTSASTSTKKAQMIVKGIGNYAGSQAVFEFTINPAPIKEAKTDKEELVYNPEYNSVADYLKDLNLTVNANNQHTTDITTDVFTLKDTDYTITNLKDLQKLDNKLDSTTGTITFTISVEANKDGNYTGTATTKTITICKKSLSSKDVTVTVNPDSYVYTGTQIIPKEVIVKDGDTVLEEGTDYTLVTNIKSNDAVDAGTAKITVEAVDGGKYKAGSKATGTFTITPAKIDDVKVSYADATYNGSKHNDTSKVTLKLGDIDVTNDFDISFPSSKNANINAGKEAGTVILTAKKAKAKNYSAKTKESTFEIKQAELTGTLKVYDEAGREFTTKQSFNYDGTAHTFASVKFVPDSACITGNMKVTENDYEIIYADNVYGKLPIFTGVTLPHGFAFAVAKGNYVGKLAANNSNKELDKAGTYTTSDKTTITSIAAKNAFIINQTDVAPKDITVANGTYAGGYTVKPVVTVKVNGKTLTEGKDYELDVTSNKNVVDVTTSKTLKVVVKPINGYKMVSGKNTSDYTFNWGIDKFDLANATLMVSGTDADPVVKVMNGSVLVDSAEYDLTVADGKVTITAKKDSKNYTGTKTADIKHELEKPAAPMISNVKVTGNKATVVLSDEAEGASGYDYVISTSKDPSDKDERIDVVKNQVQTTANFKYVPQGTYYAYCHAWTRDENGKKVFGEWSNSYAFSVTAITPDTPEILSVKAKGSTITVTYKESANSTGYDVVLGKGSKKEHGETRPYQYGKYKKLNVKPGVCKAVFKNVPAGTYYAGVHSWNRTASENDNKVFSKWSNLETAKVK